MSEKTAGRHDLQMRDNETFVLHLTYRDPNGLPVDLTGHTVRMQVRDKAGGTVLLDSDDSGTAVIADPLEGKIDVTFPRSDMLAVTARIGVYDLALVSPTAQVDVLIEGTVAFIRGVTV